MILDSGKIIKNEFYVESINSSFEFHWDEFYSYQGEYHDFPEIVYVEEGEVLATEEDRVYNMKAGDLVIHAAMEFHKIQSAAHTNPSVYIIGLSCCGKPPEKLNDGVFHLSQEERETFLNLFKRVYAYHHGEESDLYLGQLLGHEIASFLLSLVINHSVNHHLSNSRTAQEYHRVVQAMYTGLYDNISLNDLAEKCHISISYIKFLFQQYAGISPKVYYTKMRSNEALRLLESGLSVCEVAEKMNFSSPNYFSVFMKKQFGLPPTEYLAKRQA